MAAYAIQHVLSTLLRRPVTIRPGARAHQKKVDYLVNAKPWRFAIETKSLAYTDRLQHAIAHLANSTDVLPRGTIPLIAVPFMGDAGRDLCRQASMNWIDLAGNADIQGPGLLIRVSGNPNPSTRRGRPSSVFAPRSARATRYLLLHWPQWLTQQAIARGTDLGEGYVSRIIRRLEEDELVVRNSDRAVRPRDPAVLLDRWREAYDFSKHRIIQGHLAARSGDDALQQLASSIEAAGVEYAATGLAAAWQYSHFAAFRTVTAYLKDEPKRNLVAKIGLRLESESPNVWLVIPNDEGVLSGASVRDGVRCVHPMQVFLDLKGHAERAPEAAERLREEHLTWSGHGR